MVVLLRQVIWRGPIRWCTGGLKWRPPLVHSVDLGKSDDVPVLGDGSCRCGTLCSAGKEVEEARDYNVVSLENGAVTNSGHHHQFGRRNPFCEFPRPIRWSDGAFLA